MKRRRWEERWDVDGSTQERDLPGGWTVEERFTLEDGRRIVATLTVRPTQAGRVPAGGITARLLRRVRVGQFAAGLRQALAENFGSDVAARLFDGAGWARCPRPRRRPARRRPDDQFYAALARDYVAWCQTGEKKPTAALAAARGVLPEQLRSQIHLARRNGFLTETGQGKAGGELTPKAQRALAQKTSLTIGRKKR